MKMKHTTPREIDSNIKNLLSFLELKQSSGVRLKLSKVKGFKPEPKNCHVNTYIQCKIEGGAIEYGWVIWQSIGGFTEAEFHSIWKNKRGEKLDITPRVDGEKKILFFPDPMRKAIFIKEQGKLQINTYGNVIYCGTSSEVKMMKFDITSNLAQNHII